MKPKKIKILYTIPNFDTAGSGRIVYDLVKHLDRSIFEPEICCFHGKGAFFKEIEKLGVKIHLFNFCIPYRPLFTFPFRLMSIVNFFRKEEFDVIHSWHWSSDFSEPLAAKLAGIPWVFTKKSMGWGNKAWKWRSSLSSKIILVNAAMKAFYRSNRFNTKLVSIPFGVDTNYYAEDIKTISKESLGINEGDLVIVTVVNLIPVKGIEFLIQAIFALNNPKVKLLIVGDDTTDYALNLKGMVKERSQISFLGKRMDVRPFHRIADLFVIPTLELGEGLPIAPIEAMAAGKRVIGSNVPGVQDILIKYPECLFNPSDVESLRDCIQYIIGLPDEERVHLEESMKAYVNSHYSIEKFLASNSNLYKSMVKDL